VVNVRLPELIQLEPTTRCNLNCVTCSRALLKPERLNKDLSLENFKKIVKSIPTLKYVDLTGFGEALFCEEIEKMIYWGASHGIRFRVISNGTIMNKKYTELILKYFDSYYISFDAANKKPFESIRKGANYEKVLVNILELIKKRKEMKSKTIIGLNMTVSHLNYMEIPEIISIGKKLGVQRVSLSPVENWSIPGEENYLEDRNFALKFKEIQRDMEKYLTSKRIHKRIEIFIKRSPLIKKLVSFLLSFLRKNVFKKEGNFSVFYSFKEKGTETCDWCFTKCFITFDGYVTPCCLRKNPDSINFGNLFEEDFKKIWNSPKMNRFRKQIIRGDPKNKCCLTCPF